MEIRKNQTIREIKDQFCFHFPGLKIEFYKGHHDAYQGSNKSEEYDENLKVLEINPDLETGIITLREELATGAVERAFEEKFGLHAQIFRRSNKIWLQTSTTDDWSLDMQNKKGLHSIQS